MVVSSRGCDVVPVAHLQLSQSAREMSDLQRMAMEMMPEVNSTRPESVQRVTVGVKGESEVEEWMKLRRRGEELRQQFGSDFQVLHDTYYAELERVKEQMAKLENSWIVCL